MRDRNPVIERNTLNPFIKNLILFKRLGLSSIPHPGVEYSEAIEAGYQMKDEMLVLDMLAPLVVYALRRGSVNCSSKHSLNPKEHHLRLKNCQTLYGVESTALAPGYSKNLQPEGELP